MKYISAEKFLEQSDKVQKDLLGWWKQNISAYDLYKTRGPRSDVICLKDDKEYINAVKDLIKDAVPLFTEGQLRKFIEEKTSHRLCLIPYCDDEAIPHYLIKFKSNYKIEDKQYCIWENDVLQTYWQVACKIAQEG